MIDFVNNPYKGAEMLPHERERLYHWVTQIEPKVILEVGTGRGGATSYMAEAIKDLGIPSSIYTCDPTRGPQDIILSTYPFIQYYKMRSDVVIQDMIDRNIPINFIFFDGPEDPEVALRNIKTLEKWITSDTYFSMHDWETTKRGYDGGESTKAALIRPYMEKSDHWEKIEVLSGLKKVDGEFNSVGLCLYQYKG